MDAVRDPVASGVFKLLTGACPEQVWDVLVCAEHSGRIFPGISLVSGWETGQPLEIRLPTQGTARSTLRGQVLQARRPELLAFSVEDASGTATYVSWSLRPHEQGCVVTLDVHDAGSARAAPEELEDAWLPILERLRQVITTLEAS